ncbi:hypothetical protein B0H15DRAFT_305998 [Mycena belliarum]|uniref:Uncharacterized protein n=1 Tax=Mycena belliarum TaxID=1033014 RepID=A0AAD6U1U2_9AGAR|nr:hypothetical protein B0H15DRAFT_305998 [Mycena belliae]
MNSSPTSPSSLSHILNPVDIPAYMEHLNPSAVSPTERQPAFTIRTSSSPSSTSGVVPDYIRDSIWSPPIAASTSKGYNMAGPSYQRQTPMHISPRHSFSPRRTSLSLDCASDPYRSYGSSPISPVSDVRTGRRIRILPTAVGTVRFLVPGARIRHSRTAGKQGLLGVASQRKSLRPSRYRSAHVLLSVLPGFQTGFQTVDVFGTQWTTDIPHGSITFNRPDATSSEII